MYKDMSLKMVPKVLIDSASMSAMLVVHHHQRGLILILDDERKYSASDGWLDFG